MRKTLLAGAVALSLGTAANTASALTIGVTEMVFGYSSAVTGSLSDDLSDSMSGTFFYQPWTATPVAFFNTVGAPNVWSGTVPTGGTSPAPGTPFSYTFNLATNQVAFGLMFDWSVNTNIPVLAIFDCTPGTTGSTCLGQGSGTVNGGVPMATAPFPGQDPKWNGSVTAGTVTNTVVPVPAAVWLFGSGLLGLVGIARRKKKA